MVSWTSFWLIMIRRCAFSAVTPSSERFCSICSCVYPDLIIFRMMSMMLLSLVMGIYSSFFLIKKIIATINPPSPSTNPLGISGTVVWGFWWALMKTVVVLVVAPTTASTRQGYVVSGENGDGGVSGKITWILAVV